MIRPFTEASLHRIEFDVIDDPVEFIIVSDNAVVGFMLPETSRPAQNTITYPRGLATEGMHDDFPRRA
jgi:hypothetical protein